jgi:hypothetical protein
MVLEMEHVDERTDIIPSSTVLSFYALAPKDTQKWVMIIIDY